MQGPWSEAGTVPCDMHSGRHLDDGYARASRASNIGFDLATGLRATAYTVLNPKKGLTVHGIVFFKYPHRQTVYQGRSRFDLGSTVQDVGLVR
jgi:hypothetical protein